MSKTVVSHSDEFYDYVEQRYNSQAIRQLQLRVRRGEDPFEILKIGREHAYYVNKIVAGLMHLSYTLYDRIMNCSQEDV